MILQYLLPLHCIFCQLPLPLYKQSIGPFLCTLCRTHYFHPDISMVLLHKCHNYFTHLNLFIYDALCRDSLIRAKFKHSLPDAAVMIAAGKETLAPFFSHLKGSDLVLWVTCVPGVNKRISQRKFDFVHYAAKKMAQFFDFPFKSKLIVRIKDTTPQKNLSQSQRYRNISGAFLIAQNLQGQHILLIDDIYTTGSTVAHIAKLLYKKGAGKVYVLSFALRP